MLIHNTTHAATMFFKPIGRLIAPSVLSPRKMVGPFVRPLSSTVPHPNKHDYTKTESGTYMTKEPHSGSPSGEGQYARTDESVRIPYPGDEHIPHTPVFPGHGGIHLKRSLAGFSLENKVSVVTGGAHGLGLAMSQAIIESGSDLAIVDIGGVLRRSPRPFEGRELIDETKGRRLGSRLAI